ncbi:ABC transporter ATP-binding protein [Cellvibrio fibrivorans]|uniref:ABC transport system ATP-binding protein n=1 Tax=Cellvibrio fibrivorans TaxID=126350 RepID=A0ABU1V186_9GAMM|nr:ABC transporter ATP-binding protein [Cellvibrio fibrivorans]MDR7091211.1 putative ABC transport system ATP-binding protein [Cellvibrio fibrivorans]
MIRLNNIDKIFRTEAIETKALGNISLEIKQGEFVAIMGPSGCGKSTLLNILGMLDNPDQGDYFFNGDNIARHSESKLSELRKHNIGFIFQSFNLIDELSVFENIELALLYHKIPAAERRARVQAVIERMEIAHRAQHMPNQLSGGQQQRVAVARALVANPKLILADEPTGNLDSVHGQEVMRLLKTLNQEGASVVIVTHSNEHASYAQRRINLFDGKIVAQTQLAAA